MPYASAESSAEVSVGLPKLKWWQWGLIIVSVVGIAGGVAYTVRRK